MIDLRLRAEPWGGRGGLEAFNGLNVSRRCQALSRQHTKRPAYLMPISTGPRVTHAEAFKQIKDRVSSAAPPPTPPPD